MTTTQAIFIAIFWGCFLGIFYSYFVYGLLIRICAALFDRSIPPPESTSGAQPSVSLLIAAFNESEVIARRIENALQTDYPREKFEIVIASDGSSDDTGAIVRRFASRGVRLLDYPLNRGKATVLNDSMPLLRGDVVVLSDANTFFEPRAVASLARWFAIDPIGAVCGRLVLTDPKTGRNADGLYWKYETFLKKTENRLGALLGSNGAIYAIRRDRYVPIPSNTIVDDFVIPLLAKVRWRLGLVYDSDAVAHEQTPADLSSEFHRRARIGAGGYQSIALLWRLLDPRRGWIALSFFSHKLLRWLCPMFMIGMIVANLALVALTTYRWLLAAQAIFYAIAAITSLLPSGIAALKPARLCAMFVGMNAALLVGFFRWLTGIRRGTWRRTSRAAEIVQTGAAA